MSLSRCLLTLGCSLSFLTNTLAASEKTPDQKFETSHVTDVKTNLQRRFVQTSEQLAKLDQSTATGLEQSLSKSSDPKIRLEKALELTAFYRTSNPRLSNQFLAIANHALKSIDKPKVWQDTIRFFQIDTPFFIANRSSIDELKKISKNRNLAWKIQKRCLEIIMHYELSRGRPENFILVFEDYKERLPQFTLEEEFLSEASKIYENRNMKAQLVRTLEILASRYPLSELSRQGLASLIRLSKLDSFGYAFSLNFIRKIYLNTTVNVEARPMILGLLEGPVRISRKSPASQLDFFQKIKFLSRLQEFEFAKNLLAERSQQTQDKNALLEIDLWKAHILGKQGKSEQSVSKFEKLVDQDDQDLDAFFLESFAENLMKTGQHLRAAEQYQRLRNKKDHYRSRWYAFWNYTKAHDFEKASKLLLGRKRLFDPNRIDQDERAFWSERLGISLGVRGVNEQPHLRFTGPKKSFYAALSKAQERNHKEQLNGIRIRHLALDLDIDSQMTSFSSLSEKAYAPNLASTGSSKYSSLYALASSAIARVVSTDPKLFLVPQTSEPLSKPSNLVFEKEISLIAESLDIDRLIIYSLMKAESGFNPVAMSSVGARGIMQIMPYTALKLSETVGDYSFNLDRLGDPVYSIFYGSLYFRMLFDAFDQNLILAIASYNAGPQVVGQWLASCKGCDIIDFIERIPYKETRAYVKKVVSYFDSYKRSIDNQDSFLSLPQLPNADDINIEGTF